MPLSQTRKPCWLALAWRFFRPPRMACLPPVAKTGLWMLILNIPFGYAGMGLGLLLKALTHDNKWLVLGTVAYALSWIMLAAGVFMAGPKLAGKFRNNFSSRCRAWRRLKQIRARFPSN